MNRKRPPTSKARGICKYYSTERGCFAGAKCKFLHGEQEELTPYDKGKTCRFYAAGYCKRGDECWFLHVGGDDAQASGSRSPKRDVDNTPEASAEEDEILCSICMDKPVTFGLLVGCSHIFCLGCIKEWRSNNEKSQDILASGVTRKCPLCRTPSKFVIPSSVFYAEDHPRKSVVMEQYKASMARVPCRHFVASSPNRRFCPFGNDCFYQHIDPDGSTHVFKDGDRALRYAGHTAVRGGIASRLEDLLAALSAFRASMAELPLQHLTDLNIHAINEATDVANGLERAAIYMPDDVLTEFMHGVAEVVAARTHDEDVTTVLDVDEVVHGAFGTDDVGNAFPPAAPQSPASEVHEVLPRPDFAAMGIPSWVPDVRTAANQVTIDYGTEGGDGTLNLARSETALDHAAQDIELFDAIPHQTVEMSAEEAPHATLQSAPHDARDEAPVVVHDSDPPFMTDGRGRVIWSSARRGRSATNVGAVSPRIATSRNKSRGGESLGDVGAG